MTARFVRKSEIATLRNFIRTHWGERHVLADSPALLEWQFDGSRLHGVSPDELSVLVIEQDGRIVAMQGIIGADVVKMARPLKGGWLCNLIADLNADNNAGLKMLKAVNSLPLDLLMTAGINPSLFRVYPVLGYVTRQEMPRWVAATPYLTSSALNEQGQYSEFPSVKGEDNELIAIHHGPFAGEWDSFWGLIRSTYFGVDRTSDHLNWRYIDHPFFEYECLVHRDPTLNGLAIYRRETIAPHDLLCFRIVELHGAEGAIEALLKKVAYLAYVSGAVMSDFSGDVKFDRLFENAGWIKCLDHKPAPPNLFQPLVPQYRPLNSAYKALSANVNRDDLGLFCAMRSDSDQDRPNMISNQA